MARPDTDITYTITYTNNGPDTASNVQMTDTFPAGETFLSFSFLNGGTAPPTTCGLGGTVSCSTSSMPSGSFVAARMVVHLDPGISDGAVLSNTASVTSGSTDPNKSNDNATVSTTVLKPRADLSITKTGPATARPEADITYTITYTNNGPDTASNVQMTDTFPAGETFLSFSFLNGGTAPPTTCGLGGTISCSTSSMPSGSFVAARMVVHLDPGLADGAILSNTATVSVGSQDVDPIPGNNQATVSTTVVKPRADLAVTKSGPASAVPDTDITYTITYTNNGPETASNVQMTDTFPAGETFLSFSFLNGGTAPPTTCGLGGTISCSTASMPSGSFVAARMVVHVTAGLADGTVLSNTATVSVGSQDVDPISANNHATVSTTILAGGRNLSLSCNGTTAFAEAAHAADLNLTGDWTVEAWFKDEDPAGFNHDYRQILMKGDRNANPEAPYFVVIGNNHLLAGTRSAGVDHPIDVDLAFLGLDPSKWHHVAVTYRADLGVLNLWLDGNHVSFQAGVPNTVGNALPLELCRNGPATGKYWQGKLDDVRIWSVARSGTDIASNFTTELNGTQAGLVANWHFNDGTGTQAVDSTGHNHTATLNGSASFSTDVHP